MDLDALHALAQFPVSIIEYTVAIAMFARWKWASGGEHKIDRNVRILLALFILAIATKQSFWAVWGAIQAHDLHGHAEKVRTHWFPIANNVAITAIGLALLGRIAYPVYGHTSYIASSVAGGLLLGIGLYIIAAGG